jgi:CDP-diacylglycerol--inositol 3-phosphatidyltransferase
MPANYAVLLFVPNLMGYARILLALVALWFVKLPIVFCALLVCAALLDLLDGFAARALDQ